MRVLSAASSAPTGAPALQAPSASQTPADSSAGSTGGAGVPESLTKLKLKEIMTFNAVMLEKELRPIKEQAARDPQGKIDPQKLMEVQVRISQAVQQKYGVTDEQVMAAVEQFNAKNDAAFKPILERIAKTLSATLG